jgi:hypothetical protein
VDHQRHVLGLFLRGECGGCFPAVLGRVPDQIRDDLAEPVSVPVADEVSLGVQSQNRFGTRSTDSANDSSQISWRSVRRRLSGIVPPSRTRVKSNRSLIIRSMRCAVLMMRLMTRPRRWGLSSEFARRAAPVVSQAHISRDGGQNLLRVVSQLGLGHVDVAGHQGSGENREFADDFLVVLLMKVVSGMVVPVSAVQGMSNVSSWVGVVQRCAATVKKSSNCLRPPLAQTVGRAVLRSDHADACRDGQGVWRKID